MKPFLQFLSSPPDHNPYAVFANVARDFAFVDSAPNEVSYVDIHGNKLVLKGSFDINGGIAVDGIVTGFDLFAADGTKVLKARGAEFDLAVVEDAFFQDPGNISTLQLFLRDSDVYGSNGDDVLTGLRSDATGVGRGGDDIINGGLGKQTLKGGKGDDTLSGGLGKDTVIGGKGKDTFVLNAFDFKADTFKDFSHKHDTIFLNQKVFTALDLGTLDKSAFRVGTKAKTDDHRVVYNKKDGALLYDEDGRGGVDHVKIAKLDQGLKIKANDFLVDV
ncbi:calcium-binding protein [Bauldia sp.]|uniref:calcium-binding protein n=1 Tax=Bauldia sp. TaxID=2575872 RepID=UPI003BAC909D